MARLVTILGFVCAFAAGSAHGATFTVTTAADSGAGSLRQAILDANANGNGVTDVIEFDILAPGVQTITLAGPLPNVTTPVLIDGYTQDGASANTLPFNNGSNAVILISLDGANIGFYALQFDPGANSSTVRGLNFQRFTTAVVLNGTNGVNVDGNFIGTDATGTIARPNGIGVLLTGAASSNSIGDVTPAQRNVISGNDVGVNYQEDTDSNVTEGNYIGTGVSGTTALANLTGVWVEGQGNIIRGNLISGSTGLPDSTGILVSLSSFDTEITLNRIGTQANGVGSIPNNYGILIRGGGGIVPTETIIGQPGAGNVIANSLADGVSVRLAVPPPVRNRIQYNTFRNNTGLGIDLNDDGVTANDLLDADTGANQLQNYPVITNAVRTVAGATIVGGTLQSAPDTEYQIQLFFAVACHASGHGEGSYVAETTVTTDATGAAAFTFSLPFLPPGGVVSVTATDPNLNTSEFSACAVLATEDPQLTIDDPAVAEGDAGTSVMTFTVTLSPASQFPVTVQVQTSDGTATAGSDYVAAGTTLTFAPGETTKTFPVTIQGDPDVEGDETFTATLSTATNASIADATGTGTITNDDAAAPGDFVAVPLLDGFGLLAIAALLAGLALLRLR